MKDGSLRARLAVVARAMTAVLAWNIARLATQLAWVVLLARALGPRGYGTFSGLAGLGIALGGFAALGMGLRLYQAVARDHDLLDEHWRTVRAVLAWTGPALLVLFIIFAGWLDADTTMPVLLAIGVSEVLLAPAVAQVAFAYAAVGRMWESAAAPVVLSVGRLFAVLIFIACQSRATLQDYAILHVASTIIAVTYLWIRAHRGLRLPSLSKRATAPELRDGAGFAALWASGLALTSLDKTTVMHAGGGVVAGEYTAGYRLASIAALPVEALSMAIMPRVFRSGSSSPMSAGLIGALVAGVGVYGVSAGIATSLAVPIVPWLLGPDFSGLLPLSVLLGAWVPAYALRLFAGNLLLGFGRKRDRVVVETCGLGVLVLIALAWLPAGGLEGALRALVAAEWGMALGMLMMVAIAASRGRRIETG